MNTSPDGRTAPLPSLTGMRWFAALLVFGLHLRNFGYFGGAAEPAADWAFGAGAVGVSFFFVLSGFVLTWTARPNDRAVAFWRRRLARIYPVHLATALAAVAIDVCLAPGNLPSVPQLLANLTLVHTWHHPWWQTLDTVSWSLSCEAFFYALFPFLHRWVVRRLTARAATVLAGLLVVVIALLPWAQTHLTAGIAYYSFPLARLPEFLLGTVLARIVLLGRWRGPGLDVALALSLIGYFAVNLAGAGDAWADCTILGFALLIPAAAMADLRALPSFWRQRRLVRLGELSFAFYMVHILGLDVIQHMPFMRQPADVPEQLTVAAIAFALALGAAWLLHEGVEAPARRLLLTQRPRMSRAPRGTQGSGAPGARASL